MKVLEKCLNLLKQTLHTSNTTGIIQSHTDLTEDVLADFGSDIESLFISKVFQ